MIDLRHAVPDHFRPNLEWPGHEYIPFHVECLGDTPKKQQECKFYENSGDEDFCHFNFDEDNKITDLCFFARKRNTKEWETK